MKVKLLKKIRRRFYLVDITDRKIHYGYSEFVLYDDKYCDEEKIRVDWFNNTIQHCLLVIFFKLDSRFYSLSKIYKNKLEKRRKKALRKKYIPVVKK